MFVCGLEKKRDVGIDTSRRREAYVLVGNGSTSGSRGKIAGIVIRSVTWDYWSSNVKTSRVRVLRAVGGIVT